MNKLAAVNYLIPPVPYLWYWTEEDDAIEWTGEHTVCLWMELNALLHFLAPHGLPPVGSILMVLMACQGKAALVYEDAKRMSAAVTGGDEPSAPSRHMLLRLRTLLEAVQGLPADLRTGLSAKAHLLRTLFEGVENRRPSKESHAILEQVDIWGLEDLAQETPTFGACARLLRDLKALAAVYEQRDFPRLEALLRSGIEEVELQPAAVPVPETAPGDSLMPLLRQLERHQDAELSAIAAAARRIVAMISLPRPAGLPQELPVGGISDITNRGALDRLLPGELAYDDLTLSARLANNEALYFRRDTPPDEPATERIILLDTGIHLWGTPRVFTLAAALGLQAGAPEGEGVRVYRRRGGGFPPLALDSVAAVRDCLTTLYPAPDPADALAGFTPDQENKLRPDVFFISIPWQSEAVRGALHGLALRVAEAGGRFYVLTLTRTGVLELSVRTAAGSRVIAGGRIDPDTIFATTPPLPDKPAVKAKDRLFNLPEVIRHLGFYQKWPLPLRFPVTAAVEERSDTPSGARIGMTGDRRLISWHDGKKTGAEELAAGLPPGRNHHVLLHDEHCVVVASGSKPGDRVFATVVSLSDGKRNDVELESSHPFPTGVKVMNRAVILGYTHKVEACALEDGQCMDSIPLPDSVTFAAVGFDGRKLHTGMPPGPPAMKSLEKRELVALPEVMQSPVSAGFDSNGRLVIRAKAGWWELPAPELLWKKTSKAMNSSVRPFVAVSQGEEKDPPPVPAWYVAEWNADCRLIFDTRGVVHVVFHDMHGLVEIAILCLQEKATAAWVRHWPAGKQYAGAKDWFLHPNEDAQPTVSLTPLLQRFYAMAHDTPATGPATILPPPRDANRRRTVIP